MQLEPQIRRQSRLSLTPLIDVIFLLLLFFMLSSTFNRFSEIALSHSSGVAGTDARPDVIVSVVEDEIKINGVVFPARLIASRLGELKAAGAQRLLMTIDANSTSQDFVSALAEIEKAEMPVTIARRPG